MPIEYLDSTTEPLSPSRIEYLDEEETVFREETGRVVTSPSDLSPAEFEYLDDTQNLQQNKQQYFGFNKIIHDAKEIASIPYKAIAGTAVKIGSVLADPSDVAAAIKAGLEYDVADLRNRSRAGEKLRDDEYRALLRDVNNRNNIFSFLFKNTSDVGYDLAQNAKGEDRAALKIQSERLYSESAKLRKSSSNLIQKNFSLPEDAPVWERVAYDIFGVGTTIAASIGLAAVTKSPIASASLFGEIQRKSIFQEGEEKGVDFLKNQSTAKTAGLIEGGLEFIGVHYFFKLAENSKPLWATLYKMGEEAAQEFSQSVGESVIAQSQGYRPVDVRKAATDALYSGFLGLFGAGGGIAVESVYNRMKKDNEDHGLGLNEKQIRSLSETLVKNHDKLQNIIADDIAAQFNPIKQDAYSAASVSKIMRDFAEGKPIDASTLGDEDRKLLLESSPTQPVNNIGSTSMSNLGSMDGGKKASNHTIPSPSVQPLESQSPIIKYREQAIAINEIVPPVQSGFVRLWRGNRRGEVGVNPSFTSDLPGIALPFRESYDGDLSYVDVPADKVAEYRSGGAGTGATDAEFMLPPDLALTAKTVPISSLPNNTGTATPASAGGGSNQPPIPPSPTDPQQEPARDYEADFAVVAAQAEKGTLGADTIGLVKDGIGLAADAFVPVSTRLGKINENLKHAVRKFVFNTGLYTHQDRVVIQPFVEKVSKKMSVADYRVFDLALKNRVVGKINELVKKYGIEKDYQAVRAVLDELRAQALDVGIDVGFLENYFPRKVKSGMAGEYIAFMRGQKEWSDIKQAMDAADPMGTMTVEDRADFANNYLRGYRGSKIQLSRPNNTKERTVDYVTPEFNQFYEDSMPTLLQYIGGMRHSIEARKMFGKSETETEDNIGAYVLTLIDQGLIKPQQELELRKLLKAVVEPTGTRGLVSAAKNASYIYLMGNPVSALTQIQDLAFSLHHNGYYQTAKSFTKAIFRQSAVTKEDIGLENILHEFEDNTRAGNAVRGVFKAVGLSWMDNIGKETYMDAALSRMRKESRKDKNGFNDYLDMVFGEESESVQKDLADGTMSENVLYLLFCELSDVQPISLAEMPVGYLRGGNGRVFYMLRSYTIKQIDVYRREIFDNLASGDVRKTTEGLRNLISLAAALMLTGMSSDALKDLLLGREIELDDLVVDNIFKVMGFTKYQIYKAREEGIGTTFFKTIFVPPLLAPVDDAFKDISEIGFGDKELKDSELLGKTPVVGKFYYWWYGGGRAKEEKKSSGDSIF